MFTGPGYSFPAKFSADQTKVWVAHGDSSDSWDYNLSEWDLKTGSMVHLLSNVRWPFDIHPDDWVLSYQDGLGAYYDLKTSRVYHPKLATGRLRQPMDVPIAESQDSRLLAISHDLGKITIWQSASLATEGNPQRTAILGGILMSFGATAFSRDSRRFMAAAQGSEAISIWETSGFQKLLTLPAEGACYGQIRFSPDERVLGVSISGGLSLWRAPSWEEIDAAEAREKAEAQLQ